MSEIPEREELIRKVVGLCQRVPGSTQWNAAEWMYDELAERTRALSQLEAEPVKASFVRSLKPGEIFVAHPEFPPHVWDGIQMVRLGAPPTPAVDADAVIEARGSARDEIIQALGEWLAGQPHDVVSREARGRILSVIKTAVPLSLPPSADKGE